MRRSNKKILLLERNHNARNERARILGSCGYEVEATHDSGEAHLLWRAILPDLVLVAADQHAEARAFWEAVKQSNPTQQIAFLATDSIYLCPVLYEGDILKSGEVTGTFVESVGALLA